MGSTRTMMQQSPNPQIFKIRRPGGRIYNIPEHNLDKAIALGGEVVEDTQPQASSSGNDVSAQPSEEKRFKVRRPDGRVYNIPERNLAKAQELGGQIVEEEDTFGKQAARSAKSLAAGAVGGLVDTATSLYNIPAASMNAANELNKDNPLEIDPISGMPAPNQSGDRAALPLIPSATEAISSSIDDATGGYTATPKGSESTQHALETIGAVASPGGLAKGAASLGAKGAAKVLGALGTTKIPGLAGAGAAGYAASEASQAGYGTAGAIGAGLGAGAAAGAATSALKNFNTKLALAKLTGNSPKNIDLEAVLAAEAAGLDASNTIVNKSKGLALAEQLVNKSPYFGTKQTKKLEAHDKSYAEAVEKSIDRVGKKLIESDSPLDTGTLIKETMEGVKQSVIDEKNTLYQDAMAALPEGASTLPTHSAKAAQEVRDSIKTLRASPDEKFLLNYLDELEAGFVVGSGNTKTVVPVPIDMLVGSKRSINDIINWDVNASGVKQKLKLVQRAFKQDIEEYGKKNPEFYKKFTDADKFYGDYLGDKALGSDTLRKNIFAQENPEKIVGSLKNISDFENLGRSLGRDPAGQQFFNSIKREKLADLIMGKVENPSGGVSYAGFSKAIENKSNQELIKYLAGDTYKDLENFNKYAKAAVRKNLRNPNPSGTAATQSNIKTLMGFVTGATSSPLPLIGAAMSGTALSWLINNKKALQWGIEAAKKEAAGNLKDANIYASRLDRLMKSDLGDDFVRQLVALQSQENLE